MEAEPAIPESEPDVEGPVQASPLSPQDYHQLSAAKNRFAPIRSAARIAAFNGWSTAVVATLSLPFVVTGCVAILIATVLFSVVFFEFRGRRGLLNLKPKAATSLGWNQVRLLALIIVYCLWRLFGGAGEIDDHPELGQLLGPEGRELYGFIVAAVYLTVIGVSVVFQGGNAIYYFTRRKHVEAYLNETPQWVKDFHKTNGFN